jgi:hypothetical protein
MTDIRDLNPRDRVDRADRNIVKGLRMGLFGFGILVLFLAAYALVEAGWVAWATIGIVFGVAAGVALLVMLVIFLAS